MKTAVTVVNTVQVSMDECIDKKTTKTFDDNATLGEIKDWIIQAGKFKIDRDKIGLSGSCWISNVE